MSASYKNPMGLPTCDVIVRRGFSSADSSLGISFITMATALSAALEPFPYNSEINNDLCQEKSLSYYLLQDSLMFKDQSNINEEVGCCKWILRLLAEEKTHNIWKKVVCELQLLFHLYNWHFNIVL